MKSIAGLVACVVTLNLIGCGGPSAPPTGIVKGVVLFEGQPIKGGQISFIPADGKTYAGDIQPNGEYMVPNIPLGEAMIQITPAPDDDAKRGMAIKENKGKMPPPPPPPFPSRYTNIDTSGLKFKVAAGTQEFKVEMKK